MAYPRVVFEQPFQLSPCQVLVHSILPRGSPALQVADQYEDSVAGPFVAADLSVAEMHWKMGQNSQRRHFAQRRCHQKGRGLNTSVT